MTFLGTVKKFITARAKLLRDSVPKITKIGSLFDYFIQIKKSRAF